MAVTVTYDRRQLRERPYKSEADAKLNELMAKRGAMPKTLDELCRWYALESTMEMPDELHTSQVWRDRVNSHEAQNGVAPVGASESGALAYADDFRRRLENSPSEVDRESGYYIRPVSAAISRLSRSRRGGPLMARHLLLLAQTGFDWRQRQENIGWPEYEVYIEEVLRRLWLEFRDAVRVN